MISINLDSVSLRFPLYGVDSFSIKRKILTVATGGFISQKESTTYISALNNVSFSLQKGDRLGLIGHNGAGKTTLLKVIAGIYAIDQGRLDVQGSVMPMFDMSLGMDMEASGYENIFIRGLMLGFTEKQIQQQLDDIARFSDLGDYLHLPAKMYSQGMLLRLAFSVSTCIKADILLFDEWIGVGDETFRKRAEERLDHLLSSAGIIVVATHDLELMTSICNKALWLEHGILKGVGEVKEVIAQYKATQK